MIDIRLIRENPDLVRENIRKKFQDAKLPLVDEVIELDKANRAAINEASNLRAERNSLSKKIGMLMGQAKKDPSKLEEAEAVKAQVTAQAARLAELEKQEEELEAKIHKIMLTIPQIIDPSVPLGPDDSCNVEVQRFGEAVVPDFPIPYHTEIMERFDGIDLDAARRVSGNGFYYLMGAASLALTAPRDLPAPGRRQTLYVALRLQQSPVFLVNSRLDQFAAAGEGSGGRPLHPPRRPFSRSYGAILPSSLTMVLPIASVCSTHPPVSVCGTGPSGLPRGFSRQRGLTGFA